MTWGEFKEKVQKEGVTDSDQLRYIDCNFMVAQAFSVSRDESGEVQVGD